MKDTVLSYELVLLFGVFLSSIAQVLLKKEAMIRHISKLSEYLNIKVISAYTIMLFTVFLSVYSYKGIPLYMGPILEATQFVYVMILSKIILNETINLQKIVGIITIMVGILFCSL